MSTELEVIIEYFKSHNYYDKDITELSPSSIHILYKLINNKYNYVIEDTDIYYLMGHYYNIQKKYNLAREYYLSAIVLNKDRDTTILDLYMNAKKI